MLIKQMNPRTADAVTRKGKGKWQNARNVRNLLNGKIEFQSINCEVNCVEFIISHLTRKSMLNFKYTQSLIQPYFNIM